MKQTGLTVEDVLNAIRYGFVKKVSASYIVWDDKTVIIIAPKFNHKRRAGFTIVTVYPVDKYKGEGYEPLRKKWVKIIERST